MYNPFTLKNKIILVTGASSGIGRSIAVECSKMGAQVIITARNEHRLQETLSMMEGEGHTVIVADVSNEEQIIALVEQTPQLDGVVHCAGVSRRVLAQSARKSDIDEVFNPNTYGPILLQRHLLKKKRLKKGSSVVFIASQAPSSPSVGNALYSASKGAILAYAKVLALELAPRDIRVNSVCPAMVWTELVVKDAEFTGANYEEAQKQYPLRRYGQPEDVAYLTIYLLSDAASWMTGSAIDITGGAR